MVPIIPSELNFYGQAQASAGRNAARRLTETIRRRLPKRSLLLLPKPGAPAAAKPG